MVRISYCDYLILPNSVELPMLETANIQQSALHLELVTMRRNVQRWQSIVGRNVGRSGTSPNSMYICIVENKKGISVKLRIWTEMSGPKSCAVLASTCRLCHSLDGCLEFWRSGRSRRVWSRAEKKLQKGESKLQRSRLLSWYSN